MITLQKRLYESLLDDEDDLINTGDENVIINVLPKIFGVDSKYIKVENGEIYCYMDLQDNSSPHFKSPIIRYEALENIFSGKYLTDFKYFKWISITTPNFFKSLLLNPINIDNIGYLYLDSSTLNYAKYKNLNIKTIDELELKVDISNISEWEEIFKNTKIDKLHILNWSAEVGKITKEKGLDLNNLNVKTLILHGSFIPGYDSMGYETDWSLVKKYINDIKKNNKIKNIYVFDPTAKTKVKINSKYVSVNKLKFL